MGAQRRGARAGDAAKSVASNPYLRRLVEDDELRDNIKNAFESARNAYGRMSNGNGPAQALVDDKKVQDELRNAAEAFKEAADGIRGRNHARRSGMSLGKIILAGVIGGIAVLVISEEARKVLLDRLFGAEEEFEYTSTTTASPPVGPQLGPGDPHHALTKAS